jgi:hypothetical protein
MYVKCSNFASESASKPYVMALKKLELGAFSNAKLVTDREGFAFLDKSHWNKLLSLITNPVEIPKEVNEVAKKAKEIGFSKLHVVWGPLSFGFEEKVVDPDPLLVGTKLGRRWILHRWGETPEEQKLIVPD